MAPTFTKFMTALMRGDYELFKQSDEHEIFPVFNCLSEARQSPLLVLRVLSLLNATRYGGSKSIEEQHLGLLSIHEYFDALSCDEAALNSVLIELIRAGLLEPYDVSNRTLSSDQRLAITPKGKVHLHLATRNNVFFTQLALTTAITDQEISKKMGDLYRSKRPFLDRLADVRSEFSKYLIDEDGHCLSQDVKSEQFEIQSILIADINKFSRQTKEADKVDSLGLHYKTGVVETDVKCTVDIYFDDRGFGFVDVPGHDEQAMVHISLVKPLGVDALMTGDIVACEIERKPKGLSVSKVNDFIRDEDSSEKIDCTVVKLFKDREYGFVSFDEGQRDAFLHLSLFDNDAREKIQVGSKLTVEIIQNVRGRGLQVKTVLECG